MDLLTSNPTTDLNTTATAALTTPVFSDNVHDLINAGTLQLKPSAIITVNSTADIASHQAGVTTLRDAIDQANTDAGRDLIVFDRSLFSNAETITLNLGELDITKNTDIIAPRDLLTGADLVTVSGNNSSRVFEIGSGATVGLFGLNIANGSVTGDNGGGIKNSGTLILDRTSVHDDSARNGGGIYNASGGNLAVINSTINNNSATLGVLSSMQNMNYGGGIYNDGTLKVSNSTLNNNSVSNFGAFGGGIYNSNTGKATVKDSTLSGNSVSGGYQDYGGGIYNDGTLAISNSTLSGNSASAQAIGIGGDGRGAGIYNNGTLTVSHDTISSNIASGYGNSGGGIYNNNTGVATVDNSTISDNSSKQRSASGGGISNSGTLTVTKSTISNNSVGTYIGSGGGIFNNGTLTVSDSTVSGNSSTASGATGGGIYNSGTLTLANSTVSGNSIAGGGFFSQGGGIYNSGNIKVINSTIGSNTASTTITTNKAGGGGIYNTGTVTLLFSTITANNADSVGGVDNLSPGSIVVRNTIIAANLSGDNSPDVSGNFTSNGYNLIGNATGSTGFGVTGDIIGTSNSPIDPHLGSLSFNGGPTQTYALLPNSPAINAGDPTVLPNDPSTDQRGFPRVVNGRADIGAFEYSKKA